jgi:WD40 repeat protein
MHTRLPLLLLWILILFAIMIPAGQAVDPLWTIPAASGDELSTVVISQDGTIIIAGGDQLIAISPMGNKLWSGWSGTTLAISRDGGYIVTSQGQTVRLFSRQGIMLWDQSLGDTVTDVSISPDAGIIVAGGGKYVQAWYNSGSGLGSNTTETVQDIQISPAKDQIIVGTATALRSFNLSYVPNWYDDKSGPAMIAISGDGTGIAIPNGNHIRMYHGSGTLLWDRAFAGGNIISLAYSRDGSTIVAGRDDTTVLGIDREGNLLWTGNAGQWVTSVGVSDDGSTIATGSIDNQIHIYNRQGMLLGTAKTKNPVKARSVGVSGDGTLIVAADSSNVYGFSNTQFTMLVTPSTTTLPTGQTTLNVTTAITQDTATIVTTYTSEGTPSLFGNTSSPEPETSPASGFPWMLVPVALAVMVLVRKR